jgi:6-pyruvoyltetrahydropterin/6-carboxytetrahydropterin synthase
MLRIYRCFTFEAAHALPHVPDGHKCKRMHGHSYSVEVHVQGQPDEKMGWVMDFADIDVAFAPLMKDLDHRTLNELPGLDNPTSENLALWIWKRLEQSLPQLARIVVSETPKSGCVLEMATSAKS